jgi:DNA-binding CsgD family transcriptional regulator
LAEFGVGLVGRDAEVAALRAGIQEVVGGRGASVWIEGEPGIGKSALLEVGLDLAAESGCQVFSARAYEMGELFPLGVVLDALKVDPSATDPARMAMVDVLWRADAASVVMPRDSVAATAEAVVALVERLCAAGSVVLAVDDVQWADEMSLAIWGRLHRLVDQLPLLLVATARPVPAREAVRRLRRGLADSDAVLLELGPLPPDESAELVGRVVGAAPGAGLRRQAERAGGNPLYLRELADALLREDRVMVDAGRVEVAGGDEGGELMSLAAAIQARLGFLSERAVRVFRMAALLGSDFTVASLSMLTRQRPTDLMDVVEEATQAGVVDASGSVLRFRHPVIRQALYEATPAGLREALHREAAEVLASAGVPVEEVAGQLLSASGGNDGWAVGWLTDAAPALIERAPLVAVDLLRRVATAIEPGDPRRIRLDVQLAIALGRLGRHDEVDRLASPLVAKIVEPELAAMLAWSLGASMLLLSRFDEGVTVISQILEERDVGPLWTARLRAMQANLELRADRLEQARRYAAQAEALGAQAGDRVAVGTALHVQSYVCAREADNAEALALTDRAIALVGDATDAAELRLLLLANRAIRLENLGDPYEADRAISRALAFAESLGTSPRLASLRLLSADIFYYRGRWDDALAELDDAPSPSINEYRQLWMSGLRAMVALHNDDRSALAECVAAIPDLDAAVAREPYYGQYLQIARALAAERDGDNVRALAELRAAFDPDSTLTWPTLYTGSHFWMPDLVRLAQAVGDQDLVAAAATACQDAVDREPLPQTRAATQHCQALADNDPTLALAAAKAFEDLRLPLFRAQALESAAALFAGQGADRQARAAYTEAVSVYGELGAAWELMRADARLRPYGIRRGVRGPQRRPTTGWDALTPTERRVASLVAEGQSNPDIAEALFLSRRTVQTHVQHILTKLGAHSRVAIATEVLARTDAPAAPITSRRSGV